MPIHIVDKQRKDILRNAEIDGMLAETDKVLEEEDRLYFKALICLAWLFGKRINEILRLNRNDFYIRDETQTNDWAIDRPLEPPKKDSMYLYVRFHVSKKTDQKSKGQLYGYTKRIIATNPYVEPILNYVRTLPKDSPLFPGHYRQYELYLLKKINPKCYWHLFRASLASEMAERGATEEELMRYFDWDRVDTAHGYAKRGPRLGDKWSRRTW
jgi:integrase